MATTTYTDQVTVITADTMNDLDRLHYDILSDPADLDAVKDTILSAPGAIGDTTPATTIAASGTVTLTGALVGDATTDSTSITTGAFQTDGGLGIAKALWVGGLVNIAGAVTLQSTLAAGNTTITGTISATSSSGTDTYINHIVLAVNNQVIGFNDTASTNAHGVLAQTGYVGSLNAYATSVIGNGAVIATFNTAAQGGSGLAVTGTISATGAVTVNDNLIIDTTGLNKGIVLKDASVDKWEILNISAGDNLQILSNAGGTTVLTITQAGAVTMPAGGGLAVTGAISGTSSIKSSSATAGIGYAAGAGGTVTQITSISTAVTLNKITGEITTVSYDSTAASHNFFSLNNSTVGVDDIVIVSCDDAAVLCTATVPSAGVANIVLYGAAAGGTAARVIKFAVIKVVTA